MLSLLRDVHIADPDIQLIIIKIAARAILKNLKTHLINVIGMSLAFTVTVFITIFVIDQLSYDKQQSNYRSIYRLELDTWSLLTGGIIPWVADQFSEVESHARIAGTYWESTMEYNQKYHIIDKLILVDGQPFEVPDYLSDRTESIRITLMENQDITGFSFSLQPLGRISNTWGLNVPGTENSVSFKIQLTDPEHFDVLGLEIIGGRGFVRNREADRGQCWIANETAARALGFEPPESIVGYRYPISDDTQREIIGIVKDYHYNSLHQVIQPSFLAWFEGMSITQVRFKSNDPTGIITHINNVWSDFETSKPLNYSFLDETFDEFYITEQRMGRLITLFTIIAVIIGCFGVFGMSAFMAKQMSRSMSLRKVMGADTKVIVSHFSKEYMWLILEAGVIAMPLAFIHGNHWLERFPYKTGTSVWIFIVALLINMLVAIGTIAYHAFHTANLNPADVLRYE